MVPEKDMLTQTRKNIEAAIDVALGGRAAEELFLGEEYVTTGCSSDLQNATNMAYSYVRDLGMKEKEVFINEKSKNLSEEYKFKVDQKVQELLKVSPRHWLKSNV
jgi:ATP-dependent metalloprotease